MYKKAIEIFGVIVYNVCVRVVQAAGKPAFKHINIYKGA